MWRFRSCTSKAIYLSSLIRVLLLVKVGFHNPTLHNQGRPFIMRGPQPALSPAGAGRGPHVLLVVGVRGSNSRKLNIRIAGWAWTPSPVSPRLMKTPRRAALSPKGARAEDLGRTLRNVETRGPGFAGGYLR